MISRVWMINAVLAIALVICGMNIWDVWHERPPVFNEKKAAAAGKDAPSVKISDSKLRNASAYPGVVDKNLFSQDRAPAPAEIEPSAPEIKDDVRISGEKVVLFGVIMVDEYKKALINNPGDRKTGSTIQWVSEGDQLGNLKVQKILADEILLIDGSDRYRVLLYDPEKAAKTVGKYSSKGEEPSQPQVISAGAIPKATIQKTGQPTKPSEKVSASTESEYETVDTPFGKMRKKRN